jgi:uncharacterized membrane protein YhiD involved in acid resistance
MTTLLFAGRLTAALLLGTVVGLERQWRQRTAGTRTNALVAAGASAFARHENVTRPPCCRVAKTESVH